MDTSDNKDVQLALEEMRLLFRNILESGALLDQKANLLLGASGLVLALVGALQISATSLPSSPAKLGLLLAALAAFVCMVALSLLAASPITYKNPIKASWDELNDCIFQRPEREAILTLLSGYVDQIAFNKTQNHRKATLIKASSVLLVLIFALLIAVVAL